MNISEFNDETEILVTTFKGELSLSEIVDYIVSIRENKIYPRYLKYITDTNNATFGFGVTDLWTIINENIKAVKEYDFIAHAIVIDNPRSAAISTIYQGLIKHKSYRFHVFSTKEAALDWLNTF